MPLLHENTNPNPPTETKSQVPANPVNKGLFTLPDSVMKLVPWIPFLLEATTGQKLPQMSGTMAEVQTALQQLQLTQTRIVNNQDQIYKEIEQLKTHANQHLSNLTHQFNSLRLTHTREKKEIAYHNQLETKQLDSPDQDY